MWCSANISNAQDVEQAERATPGGAAAVLPAVYLVAPADQRRTKQQRKGDEARAAKDFGVVIEVPSRPGYYCAAVDKAMELKLKKRETSCAAAVTSCRPIAAVCLAALLGGAASVAAQTPRGEGNLTLMYEQGYTRGQLNNAGELIAPDSTDAHALVWDVHSASPAV